MDDIVPGVPKLDTANRGHAAIVRSIARATRAPLVVLDGQLRIVGANAAFAKLLSTTKRALLGQALADQMGGPWNESGLLKRIAAVRTDKAAMRDAEYEFDTGMGDRRLFRLNARPARTSDAADDAVLLTVEDITDERRAANELRFANALLMAQMEGSPDGILVVDENAQIVSYNRRFLEVAKVPPDLVATKVDDSVLTYVTAQAKDPEAFLARVRYLYDHPEMSVHEEVEMADGRIIDRHTSSLRDETGKYLGRVWFFRDVTKQRWDEAAIREALARAQIHSRVVDTISRSDAVISGGVELLTRQITELASAATGCERVNVWLFNDDESELTCIDNYEATPGTHSSGTVLLESQYRGEFQALKAAPYVDANDPLTDPRTAGYVEGYIKPLGITSMLDTVILASGKNMGLLCFEHVGRPHHWQKDEIEFAERLADKIGLALISRKRRRAEAKVRASADALAEAQAIAHVGNWEFDCRYKTLTWSDEVYRIFGVDPATFTPSYESFLSRIHPDDRAAVDEDYTDSVANRTNHDIDHRILMADGGVKVVHERGRTFYDSNDLPIRSVGTVTDITERKRAEENLRVATAIVEASPTVLFRWSPAEGWPITYVSPNVTRVFGYDAAELTDPPKPYGPMIHADDLAHLAREVEGHVAAGRTGFVQEYRLLTKSGEARWVEDTTSVERDDEGRVLHFQGTVTDIAERKRAEEMLHASRDLLHTVVESAPVRIFWKDTELRYLGCNAAFARDAGKARPEDLIGKDDFQMGWRDQAELYRADDKRVMESDTPKIGYEEPQTAPDGSTIWLRTSKVPLHDGAGKVMGILGVYEDITENKRAEIALRKTNRTLQVLSAGNAVVAQATEERALLHEMCRMAVEIGGYRMAWIGFAQHDAAKTVRPVAIAGGGAEDMKRLECSWADDEKNSSVPGMVIRTGTPQVSQNLAADPQVTSARKRLLAEFGFVSAVALPLRGRTGPIGAMLIYSAEPNAFDTDETKLLIELADNVSFGIAALRDRAEGEVVADRLQRSMETTIEVVAGTLEQRDPYTAGHQRRVALLAEAMARRMSLSEDRVHGLRLAGLVHDLGKIYIPAELLSKPSRLTPIEYEMIKTHSQVGYDILKNVDFPWPIATMVVQHHERMDGTGYPNGLRGDDIIVEARILAVADVVESMMSHRPYRPTRGLDVALAEIERGRGTAYDPAAVDACLTLFRQDGFTFD